MSPESRYIENCVILERLILHLHIFSGSPCILRFFLSGIAGEPGEPMQQMSDLHHLAMVSGSGRPCKVDIRFAAIDAESRHIYSLQPSAILPLHFFADCLSPVRDVRSAGHHGQAPRGEQLFTVGTCLWNALPRLPLCYLKVPAAFD